MNPPGDLDFYSFVLFLHIASAVIAFGVTFAYPVIQMAIMRGDVRALPAWHTAEEAVGRKLITPGAILVLLSGIYMALDRWDDFGGAWFSAAGVIVVVLLGLGHGFFVPQSRRLKAQAEADLAAGAAETGRMSAAYDAIGRRVAAVGILSSLLVLLALLLMVWKPGA
jgi:Predicted integral membrane protein (DUF2269)